MTDETGTILPFASPMDQSEPLDYPHEGTVIDFETGLKTQPTSSHPFPWVKFIDEPNGGFARFQIDHETFIDKPLTAERAMGLCTDLALIATKLLRDGK